MPNLESAKMGVKVRNGKKRLIYACIIQQEIQVSIHLRTIIFCKK